MRQRCLVLLSGVSEEAYLKANLEANKPLYEQMVKLYGEDNIFNIDYQPILDRHALFFKSILDPIRYALTPNGWIAEEFIEEFLNDLELHYREIDVISHSMGSWLIYKCDAKINKLINLANPIGFFTFFARTAVRMNLHIPRINTEELFYIYSKKDLICKNKPRKIEGTKWDAKASKVEVIETGTGHDAREYLDYLFNNRKDIFI